ncbi:MAG: arginine--tRNA ligase [Erysipelotrichaceae bacterium]|nr:arginine--tRNA ligase [Erysipelotrichaceae bacterium]
MSIKTTIGHMIKCSLDKIESLDNIEENKIIVEIPNKKENGDYSTNIALTLTKQLHKPPMEIAKEIANNIEKKDIIEEIKIASPGFINFYLKKDYLLEQINIILNQKKDYGRNNIGAGKKVNIEFVSANPTGILHIGHGRGATYGDNLARIMTFSGFDITKEYYINDAGNQMNNLGISIKERYKQLCGLPCNLPENGYHGKEIITLAQSIYDRYKETKLDNDIEFFKQQGLEKLLARIKKDLDRYRVNFNIFTSEQSLYDKCLVDDVLNQLRNSDNCYIKEDALWLKTSSYGDEKDRVLIKSDGNYTYLTPDIAYHIDKINRGYDELIDVLGSDHHGYINRLKAALIILGKNSNILDIKILQMVRLIKDGEELKLSKRTGKTITLMDLVDEIGVNATRYFFSSHSLDTSMDLNIDLALKQSNENPVYYIEYANARICSILKNYKKKIIQHDKYTTLNSEETYTILNKLSDFQDVVISASLRKEPHLIANYVYDLASTFHSFYAKEKMITEDELATSERMNLLLAIQIVIQNALDLLGIIPREEM